MKMLKIYIIKNLNDLYLLHINNYNLKNNNNIYLK